MNDLEWIRRQIRSTETLHSVVRTMKILSMTSIHQCEQAVASLEDYERTVRLGLQGSMRHRPRGTALAPTGGTRVGAVVFGSAWGMCGRFNEQIAEHAAECLATEGDGSVQILGLGELIGGRLEDVGRAPDRTLEAPVAVEQITPRVQDLLVDSSNGGLTNRSRRCSSFSTRPPREPPSPRRCSGYFPSIGTGWSSLKSSRGPPK